MERNLPSTAKKNGRSSKGVKPLIYHTDGNYLEVIQDLISIGFDGLHPNEAKAGIDVVKLKEKYNGSIAFFCNIDAAGSLSKDKAAIEKEILYKIRAADGGGYLPGGDDIPPTVSPQNYDFYINLLKQLRKDKYKGSG